MEIPEKGFYYHYKHDPKEGIYHHAYEVLDLARHTEDESYLVRYRPLYKNSHLGEATEYVRPLDLWFNEVEWEGKKLPRFTKVTDPKTLEKLTDKKQELYG